MMSQRTSILVGWCLFATIALIGSVSPANAALSLAWSDEFDGDSLDTGNWTIDIGDGCPDLCGWGNNELEYYRAQNVAVTGGNLILTARRESYAGRVFTSGKVHTRDKRSFLYGRMEMRAKIPTGDGIWPAFWMMPQDDVYGGWAASGEIDIMESANTTDWINGTIHYGGTWPDNTSQHGTYDPGNVNFADDFHVYAVEWEPEEIRWYVDGVLFSTKYSWQWRSDGAPDNPLAPFDQDFYLILNTAVGGYYTGCTETWCVTADLPQEYVIDYVRVYQESSNLAPTVSITDPTEGDNPPAGDITISAVAADEDGTITAVEFYAGTTFLGEDTTEPYAFTCTSVADGCYAITARAVDDAGAFGTDTADITVGTGCGQASFLGAPAVLPARIEAEDYDIGGEGVAYHDTDSGNTGGQYRMTEDVDVQTCTDVGGGYNVGWLIEGEWLEYTVDAPVAGDYPIEIRVASQSVGGVFHIEFNGDDKTGDVTVPVTGGWQTWTTVSTTAALESGLQVMRFVPTVEGFNLNAVDILEPTVVAVSDLQPAGFALLPCYPNPFNPRTTIAYTTDVAGMVRLQVFDLRGQLIATLVDESLAAGAHQVVWQGRDSRGDAVPSGVYFSRLESRGKLAHGRMVLVR